MIKQLISIFQEFSIKQKAIFLLLILFVGSFFGFLIYRAHSKSSYQLLFPARQIGAQEREEIKDLLVDEEIGFKEDKNGGLRVARESLEAVRSKLHPKQDKGFELFDSSTWIKGEKELQVLEMRALKGQLESDLAQFDNIKSANVILDLAPQRLFNNTPYKTKASVILTLIPDAKLSISELKAITYHVTGAVRGLEPSMVAISDTAGKLYKEMGKEEIDDQIFIEESINAKIERMLLALMQRGEYHITVSLTSSLSIALLVDSKYAHLENEIRSQIDAIVKNYDGSIAINFVAFQQKPSVKKKRNYWLYSPLALAPLLLFLRKRKKNSVFHAMNSIDIEKLSQEVAEHDPERIALLLSYLDPEKAESLVNSLPEKFQEQVLVHLAEIEEEQ